MMSVENLPSAPSVALEEADAMRILSQEGLHVEPATQLEVQGPISHDGLEKLSEHVVRYIDSIDGVCRSYLAGALITDDFKEHSQRRAWRHELHARYGMALTQALNRNRLRLNNLSALYSFLQHLGDVLQRSPSRTPQIDALIAVCERVPSLDDYDQLALPQKRAIVASYDDIARDFLRIVHSNP